MKMHGRTQVHMYLHLQCTCTCSCTVKPPIVDALRKGQPLKRGQSKCPKVYKTNIKQPLRRGQPPNKGQKPLSQSVVSSEVSLYMYMYMCVPVLCHICVGSYFKNLATTNVKYSNFSFAMHNISYCCLNVHTMNCNTMKRPIVDPPR